jgi:hypothetical protein
MLGEPPNIFKFCWYASIKIFCLKFLKEIEKAGGFNGTQLMDILGVVLIAVQPDSHVSMALSQKSKNKLF